MTTPLRLSPSDRERIRKAVERAVAITKARNKRRANLWHAFLKTIRIPLT